MHTTYQIVDCSLFLLTFTLPPKVTKMLAFDHNTNASASDDDDMMTCMVVLKIMAVILFKTYNTLQLILILHTQ